MTISLGRPLALYDDDIYVQLPSDLDDAYLERSENSAASLGKTSPFLHHIRLRIIQAQIHRSMYTSRSTQSLSLRERQMIRRDLYNELQNWKDDIEYLALPTGENRSEVPLCLLPSQLVPRLVSQRLSNALPPIGNISGNGRTG